jgi:DNA end-binding protein Ku
MIRIRFRAFKRAKWQSREFELNCDAERFCLALPDEYDCMWEGSAERPDPTPQHAMWSGAVSFGMVNVPIKLYSAVEDGKPALKQLCKEHNSPLHFKRWCDHGHELHTGDIIKGVEVGKTVIPLEGAELASLPKGLGKSVAIDEFVPAGSIPVMHRERPYFVGPDKAGRHAYDLLVAALRDTGTVAIARVVIREREHLAALEPSGDGLVLWTLRRSTEIRASVKADAATEIAAPELAMARELVKSMTKPMFEPMRHPDRYATALTELVDRKVETAVPVEDAPNVVDLMASLQKSVEQARTPRRKAS